MSNVYVGQLTTEVHATGGPAGPTGDDEAPSPWEKQARLAATIDRLAALRARTATGQP